MNSPKNSSGATALIIALTLLLATSISLNIAQWFQPRRLDVTSIPTLPIPQSTGTTTTNPSDTDVFETLMPTTSLTPMPTVSQISVCSRTPSTWFPTFNQNAYSYCQTIELRARDLLRTTYNTHQILNEIRSGQIQQYGALNKINNLNNELVDLWMNIVGYGLGTDPHVNVHIMVGNGAFKDAATAPSYGLSSTPAIGMPRLFNTYIESSSLPSQTIQAKEAAFLQLVQEYTNPAVYPHRDLFDRAYHYYREGKLLDTEQYNNDLTTLNIWLTNLEKVLLTIPTYLHP